MSKIENLKDLYIDELQDLWSANDQMQTVIDDLAEVASDSDLGARLKRSRQGIQKHTDMLKSLIEGVGGEANKQHCKGMEGLVAEARNHALEADMEGAVRDVAIIAQYQRMCHYGLAGFGTAKAYAAALNREDDATKLAQAVEDIYESDEYVSDLAERSKNLEAV